MCNNIILNKRICDVCHNVMNLNLDNSKKDGLYGDVNIREIINMI